jgi:hypothetical protein
LLADSVTETGRCWRQYCAPARVVSARPPALHRGPRADFCALVNAAARPLLRPRRSACALVAEPNGRGSKLARAPRAPCVMRPRDGGGGTDLLHPSLHTINPSPRRRNGLSLSISMLNRLPIRMPSPGRTDFDWAAQEVGGPTDTRLFYGKTHWRRMQRASLEEYKRTLNWELGSHRDHRTAAGSRG